LFEDIISTLPYYNSYSRKQKIPIQDLWGTLIN